MTDHTLHGDSPAICKQCVAEWMAQAEKQAVLRAIEIIDAYGQDKSRLGENRESMCCRELVDRLLVLAQGLGLRKTP